MNSLCEMLGISGIASDKTMSKLGNMVKAQMLKNFYQKYVNSRFKLNDVDSAARLFYSTDREHGVISVPERIANLKRIINETDNLQHLRGNALLEFLAPGITVKPERPQFFWGMASRITERSQISMMKQAWKQLLTDPTENIRLLAQDLIAYSFYQNGGSVNGGRNFLKFIPYEFLSELHNESVSYKDYVKSKLDYRDADLLEDDLTDDILLRNMLDDTSVCTTLNKYNKDKWSVIKEDNGKPALIKTDGCTSKFIRVDSVTADGYPFIAYYRRAARSERGYAAYIPCERLGYMNKG